MGSQAVITCLNAGSNPTEYIKERPYRLHTPRYYVKRRKPYENRNIRPRQYPYYRYMASSLRKPIYGLYTALYAVLQIPISTLIQPIWGVPKMCLYTVKQKRLHYAHIVPIWSPFPIFGHPVISSSPLRNRNPNPTAQASSLPLSPLSSVQFCKGKKGFSPYISLSENWG